MGISRCAAAAAAVSLSAAFLASAGGSASAAARSAGGPTQSVTLALAPADPAGLKALAHASGLSRSQRLQSLAQVIPSASGRTQVESAARSLGLRVVSDSRWAVRVTGPAGLIRQLFGSARANNPHSKYAHNLPVIPASMRGMVTTAFGGDETRPLATPMSTVVLGNQGTGGWVGSDLRGQYSVGLNPAPTGTQTIATVQLSDWNAGDLSTYIANESNTGPLCQAAHYTSIKDSFDPPVVDPNSAPEVALDQETICGTDPSAFQRAYISGNDGGGFFDDLINIGNDASNPLTDGSHITAASISWGFCEDPSANAAPFWDALENAMQYVVASGVTVFASTGDTGADCNPGQAGIPYPASSPEVVAVGGTSPVDASTTTVPTAEQVWNDGFGSTGGGASQLFFQPSYQANDGLSETMRTIPDISSLASIPGFEVFSTAAGGWGAFFGTSLASPTSAALFTDVLAEHGYQWGIGDIHAGLYGKGATHFTDITSGVQGSGGASATSGYDLATGLGTPLWDALVPALGGNPHLSVPPFYFHTTQVPVTVQQPDFQAYQGYRLGLDFPAQCGANGLTASKPTVADFSVDIPPGAPSNAADGLHNLQLLAVDGSNTCHWSNSQVFIDTQRPTVHATLGLASPTVFTPITARWSFSDPAPSSGLGHFSVVIRNQAGTAVYNNPNTTATSASVSASQGSTYTVTVTALDRANNSTAAAATAKYAVPIDDVHFSYAGTWANTANSAAFGHSYHSSTQTNATAHYTADARSYTLLFVTGTSGGKALVYVGSTLVKTVDLYSSTTRYMAPEFIYSSSTLASRTITVKVSGQKNAASHGFTVYVDALQATV